MGGSLSTPPSHPNDSFAETLEAWKLCAELPVGNQEEAMQRAGFGNLLPPRNCAYVDCTLALYGIAQVAEPLISAYNARQELLEVDANKNEPIDTLGCAGCIIL